MNWDAVEALAGVFGAAAVVVSLVYLAAQIRQSARVSSAAAFQGIIDGITEHFRYMYAPENAELVAKGLEDFGSLSPTERMGFEALMAGLINQVEASLITLHSQMMSEDTIENWAWWLQTRVFCYEGARTWWSEARRGYQPEVAAWIDRQWRRPTRAWTTTDSLKTARPPCHVLEIPWRRDHNEIELPESARHTARRLPARLRPIRVWRGGDGRAG